MGLKELKETANEKLAELGSWIDEHPESYLTGVMAVAGLASVVLFVADKNRRKHSKKACADNYAQFGDLIVHDVDVAEFVEKHLKGAEKKEWVLAELQAMAHTLNYEIDWNVVSEMIDKICDASKEINPPQKPEGE